MQKALGQLHISGNVGADRKTAGIRRIPTCFSIRQAQLLRPIYSKALVAQTGTSNGGSHSSAIASAFQWIMMPHVLHFMNFRVVS